MNCDFDNAAITCDRCGKKAPSRKTKSNCLPTMTEAEKAAILKKIEHAVTQLPAAYAPTSGPGSELSKLLKRFGIEPTPTCACRAKAAEMDAWGCDECSKPERIEEVVAVMREEAKARGLPFVDMAGRVLVRRAISNARRESARATQATTAEGQDAQVG